MMVFLTDASVDFCRLKKKRETDEPWVDTWLVLIKIVNNHVGWLYSVESEDQNQPTRDNHNCDGHLLPLFLIV